MFSEKIFIFHISGAESRTRTGTDKVRRILSPLRLPIPPPRPCTSHQPLEAAPGFEPGYQGFADPCLTTWLCRQTDK